MIRPELSLRIQNSPGAVARICDTLGDARVNILALAVESGGVLRMVVDNHIHAAGALREHQYEVAERDVLCVQVPNAPGSFVKIARMLAAADINVDYMYGTAIEGQPMAVVIIGVPDAMVASAAAGV